MNATLAEALRLATLGYAVFPCAPGQKRPATANGLLDASIDPERITAWWTAAPNANIGLRTDCMLVIDVDGSDNPWLTDQHDRLMELADAPLSRTPRGGKHFIFRQPEGRRFRNTAGKLADKVDTRGDGGYILVPPSIVDGKPYRWVNRLDAEPEKLGEPPAWLLAMLETISRPTARVDVAPTAADVIPAGQRNSGLTKLAGRMRHFGMSQTEIEAALRQANQDRCKTPLDETEVLTIARSVARYEPDALAASMSDSPIEPSERGPSDPGETPAALLHIPGFVDAVIDHMMATAPYPNLALAFAAAMPLQGFLASRKVSDGGASRSNIYVVSAAPSGAGKDWPRRVARRVLQSCGLGDSCGGNLASGEGLEDLLFLKPSFFLLADEFHYLLAAIKQGRDVRWQGVAKVLLELYTSAAEIYDMRIKAGTERMSIDQPALTVAASAIPSMLYDSMSTQVLTNGLFARLLIISAGPRGRGRKAIERDLPQSIIDAACHWADFRPGTPGNLATEHPTPLVLKYPKQSDDILDDFQADADDHYARAEANGDDVGTSVWARAGEKARRLGLIYACSLDYRNPNLPPDGAKWACDFVAHQTAKMLFMAGAHVSESAFHADTQKMEAALRDWAKKNHSRPMLPYQLRRRMRGMETRQYDDALKTLIEQGRVSLQTVDHSGAGRPTSGYVAIGA